MPEEINAAPNISFQANGGFAGTLFGKKVGGTLGIIYSKNNRYQNAVNQKNLLLDNSDRFTIENSYHDERYLKEISVGALGSFTLQLDPLNKVSLKSIINVNSSNSVTQRLGVDRSRPDTILRGTELTFKQNTFFTTQLSGEHSIITPLKFKWYGAFNILDGYIPDQRRILYSKTDQADPYRAVIANSLSQQSGSRIYQTLNDYIYTAGGDLSYVFTLFNQKQTLKGGYMLQIRDRLYDAKLFANFLPVDNDALRQLPADRIFIRENFGDGFDNKFAFDAIKGNTFRYLANTILNAGFLQFEIVEVQE